MEEDILNTPRSNGADFPLEFQRTEILDQVYFIPSDDEIEEQGRILAQQSAQATSSAREANPHQIDRIDDKIRVNLHIAPNPIILTQEKLDEIAKAIITSEGVGIGNLLVSRLERLVDQEYRGPEAFLAALEEAVGARLTKQHGWPLLHRIGEIAENVALQFCFEVPDEGCLKTLVSLGYTHSEAVVIPEISYLSEESIPLMLALPPATTRSLKKIAPQGAGNRYVEPKKIRLKAWVQDNSEKTIDVGEIGVVNISDDPPPNTKDPHPLEINVPHASPRVNTYEGLDSFCFHRFGEEDEINAGFADFFVLPRGSIGRVLPICFFPSNGELTHELRGPLAQESMSGKITEQVIENLRRARVSEELLAVLSLFIDQEFENLRAFTIAVLDLITPSIDQEFSESYGLILGEAGFVIPLIDQIRAFEHILLYLVLDNVTGQTSVYNGDGFPLDVTGKFDPNLQFVVRDSLDEDGEPILYTLGLNNSIYDNSTPLFMFYFKPDGTSLSAEEAKQLTPVPTFDDLPGSQETYFYDADGFLTYVQQQGLGPDYHYLGGSTPFNIEVPRTVKESRISYIKEENNSYMQVQFIHFDGTRTEAYFYEDGTPLSPKDLFGVKPPEKSFSNDDSIGNEWFGSFYNTNMTIRPFFEGGQEVTSSAEFSAVILGRVFEIVEEEARSVEVVVSQIEDSVIKEVNSNVELKFLGFKIHSEDGAGTLISRLEFSKTKPIFEKHFFPANIPVIVRAGVFARLGVRLVVTAGKQLKIMFGPLFEVGGQASAALDAFVIRVGLGIKLTLINIFAGITATIGQAIETQATLNLTLLKGEFKIFAEHLGLECEWWKCKAGYVEFWRRVLASFTAFETKIAAWSETFTFIDGQATKI